MSGLYCLLEVQVERLSPYFPKSRGKPRFYDRRVISGMIYINHSDLMWKHAPRNYGPPRTLYNRSKRWSRMDVVATTMTELAVQAQDIEMVMIDAAHLKTHRMASSLAVQKGGAGGRMAGSTRNCTS